MPKFPRFTSGTFGRLDFATMNDLFDRVEQLESQLGISGATAAAPETEIVVVKPLSLIATANGIQQWSWRESIIDFAFAETSAGERSGTGPNGNSDYPLFGRNLNTAGTYLAKALYDDSGNLFYRAIEEPAQQSDVIAGRITGSLPSGTSPGRWTYNLTQVDLNGQNLDPVSPAFNFAAYNGCEYVADPTPPSTGPYGVGAEVPAGLTTVARKPIRVGVIAVCAKMPSGGYVFSIPNGYQIVC